MADFIEGKRPVIEALRTGVPIKSILMADNVQRDGLIEDILRKAKRAGATVEMVPRKVLDGKSDRGSHQGVMAKAASFPYVGIGDVIDAAGKSAEQHDGRALVIILDHITDAGNLGAVSRSAEAVGACGIVIPNKRSAHVEASTYKRRHRARLRPHLEGQPQGQDRARDGQRAGGYLAPGDGALRLPGEAAHRGRSGVPQRGASRHRLHVRVAAPEPVGQRRTRRLT